MIAVLSALAACLLGAAGAGAQTSAERPAAQGDTTAPAAALTPEQQSALSRANLAREFGDPLTTVPQISIQDIYVPQSFGTDARTNRLLLRPIIPRVPKFSLLPFVQLIRPTFSMVTVPTGAGGETRTEFGDIQLLDLAVLPWSSKEDGLYMGFGPVFNFPTATHKSAGLNAWQLGPALATIYKGIPGLLVGCLIQSPFSLAYTADVHASSGSFLFQPLVLAYLGHGFYVKSADSTWTYTWDDGGARMLPLSFGIGYIWLREGSPPINVSVNGEWMAYRHYGHVAPVAPQTSIRFALTVAFPQWQPWR